MAGTKSYAAHNTPDGTPCPERGIGHAHNERKREVNDGVPTGHTHPEPVCPDCAAGKHPNCTGEAWDFAADEPTTCTCQAAGHR